MSGRYSIWIFVAAVVLIPVSVFGVVKWYEHRFTPLPVLGGQGHTVSDFTLVNQEGRPTTFRAEAGKITVADFFFTHCPVVCPKMTRSLKRVQQAFGPDAQLRILSLSVDPERDSAAQLRKYAGNMDIGGNWQLLTGTKQEIYRLARKDFKVVATDGDGGDLDFIHSELLVLLDGSKRIRGYYNGTVPAEVDELMRDIQRLRKEEPAR